MGIVSNHFAKGFSHESFRDIKLYKVMFGLKVELFLVLYHIYSVQNIGTGCTMFHLMDFARPHILKNQIVLKIIHLSLFFTLKNNFKNCFVLLTYLPLYSDWKENLHMLVFCMKSFHYSENQQNLLQFYLILHLYPIFHPYMPEKYNTMLLYYN